MADLFKKSTAASDQSYTAQDIEVLEGLEPVRRRPGMYIGGTDERALHHLAAEVFDNAMDEAVAGHASRIEITLEADGSLTVHDNGRGIPVDPHPKFKPKSALEVILTTLHSGGKFGGKAYATSGGLHGVGISVVNALSERLTVEIARDKQLYEQSYSRGAPVSKLRQKGPAGNRRGTTINFYPDKQIFGAQAHFKPALLYKMARAKAYLYAGVEIRWKCAPELLKGAGDTPESEVLHFSGGLADYLNASVGHYALVTPNSFTGSEKLPRDRGKVEWAIAWYGDGDAL
ncbi:MAG TPA: ATP-binding protein, partial [Alphaproteobacteria bacterium]|nr:ATP-binding protein [Alphaproteobacteria bacterium]